MTCYNSELPIGPPGPPGPQGPAGESAALPYKVYTALVTQEGVDAVPIAIELENTIGDISYTYNTVGSYSIISDSLFTSNKTTIFVGPLNNGLVDGFCVLSSVSISQILISTNTINALSTIISSDQMLINTPIEIRVYN
jgi:hypothetical protein